MKYEYNCFFCHNPLTATDRYHSQTRFIYICDYCPGNTEHLFYNEDRSLTLRTKIQFKDIVYTLYLYAPSFGLPPLDNHVLLVRDEDNKHILKLPSRDGFSPGNIQAKVERLLQLKAFY